VDTESRVTVAQALGAEPVGGVSLSLMGHRRRLQTFAREPVPQNTGRVPRPRPWHSQFEIGQAS
jgi:hypothetical protein